MTSIKPLIRAVLVLLLLALVAGATWNFVATPAEALVTERGFILTEDAAKQRFGVIVDFVVIGVVVSAAWGLWFGWRLRGYGWVLVPVFVFGTLAAASLAAWFGMQLGPQDPETLTSLQLGESAPQQLALDSFAPLIVWPIVALLGLVWGVYSGTDSSGDGGDDAVRHGDEVAGR